MKRLNCNLSCLLFLLLSSAVAATSQTIPQTRKIRHVEHYQTGVSSFRNEKLPAKATVGIVSDDISDDGIGSAYISHTFSLDNSQSVSSYNWKFCLKDKSGGFVLMQTGNSTVFTINPVSDTADLYINADGELEGKIECDYVENGESQMASPFDVSLELKPTIVSIKNFERHEYDLYNFYLTFDVEYSGANSLSVEIEEDYNTAVTIQRFAQPSVAHINTGNLSTMVMTRVTIVVSNKYGSTYKTYEFEPTFDPEGGNSDGDESGVDDNLWNYAPSKIELATMDGKMIFSGDEDSFNSLNLIPGIYIKREHFEDGSQKTTKIIIR